MNTSDSGILSTEFVNASDSFSDYTEISRGNHNRLVKAKRFGKWHILKGLKEEYADKAIFVELLRKEFDMGILLDHPNIIRTIGKENDSYIGDCIVLEYIDGVTLKEWLGQKPTGSERRRVALQLLDAMSYFHTKGIIHRDLKPDNILITRNGANVKVIDFGLSDSDEYAIFKQPAGNRRYSAPEQSDSRAPIDLRADIYAFGAMLSEFKLSGIYKHIAKKATREHAADRYTNAEQIIAAIHNRTRRHLVEIISFAAILVGFGLYSLVQNSPVQQQLPPAITINTTAKEKSKDTLYIIKEIPVAVEKVVFKDSTESDSTYIARKKWERTKIETATREINKLCAPMKEVARKSKTKNAYYQEINFTAANDQYGILRQKLISDIPRELDFYFEFENRIATIYGNNLMDINKIIDTLPQE